MNNSAYIALLGTSLVIALLYKHIVAIDSHAREIVRLQNRVWELEKWQQQEGDSKQTPTLTPKPTPKPAPVKSQQPQPANANQQGRKNGRRK